MLRVKSQKVGPRRLWKSASFQLLPLIGITFFYNQFTAFFHLMTNSVGARDQRWPEESECLFSLSVAPVGEFLCGAEIENCIAKNGGGTRIARGGGVPER